MVRESAACLPVAVGAGSPDDRAEVSHEVPKEASEMVNNELGEVCKISMPVAVGAGRHIHPVAVGAGSPAEQFAKLNGRPM